jgi:hypothetical protein
MQKFSANGYNELGEIDIQSNINSDKGEPLFLQLFELKGTQCSINFHISLPIKNEFN